MRILSIFFLLVLPGLWAVAEDPSWLNLFSRAEKKTLTSYLDTIHTQQSSLREDWKASEGAYREYRRNAQILALALDRYRGDPPLLTQQVSLAGLGALAPEAVEKELSVNRLLELQRAQDLAFQRYGHPGPRGFISAGTTEKELETQGRSLSQYLGKRITKYSKKSLTPMALYFEKELASLPDCPSVAFKELETRAAALDASPYRSWILALAQGSNRNLAHEPPVGEGKGEALVSFREAYGNYVKDYELKNNLLKILPALASASTRIDSLTLSERDKQVNLADLHDFIQTLGNGSIDRESFRRVVLGEVALYRPFVEFGPLLWIAYTQMGDTFVSSLGLDEATVRRAVINLYEVFQTGEPSAGVAVPLDTVEGSIEGVVLSDAFAERVLNSTDPMGVVRAYSSFWSDVRARSVFFHSDRYAEARQALIKHCLAIIQPLISPAEALVEWGGSEELVLSARQTTGSQGEHSMEKTKTPETVTDKTVADKAVADKALGSEEVAFKAVAPRDLLASLKPLRFLIDPGILIVTYPSMRALKPLEPNEWALAYDGAPVESLAIPSEKWNQESLDAMSRRYGIPPSFAAPPPGETRYPATLRYALISGTALRLGEYLNRGDAP